MEYVIAILFCLGDKCDVVRPEPEVFYQTYEACSQATATKSEELGKIVETRRAGREGEILCLHDELTMAELDEEHEALVSTEVRASPLGTARPIGTVAKGNKVRVTGAVLGTKWLRIGLPNGGSGYIFSERFRKLSFLPEPTVVASVKPPVLTPPPPPVQPAAPAIPPPSATPPPLSATSPPRRALQEFHDCDKCPVLVVLPTGSFEMGSSADVSERPIHRVQISSFAIGKYLVTVGEWNECVAATVCTYKHDAPNERMPITNVSWEDAQQYVQWLKRVTGKSYRLPTEAEWEYAARAGTSTPYSWGPQVGVGKANCNGCGGTYDPKVPAIVGSVPANPWGLHDMGGSVAQWNEDCWHKNYDSAPTNGTAWATPHCPTHVLRGGSWKSPPKDITVSSRNFYDTSVRYITNGFRVASSQP